LNVDVPVAKRRYHCVRELPLSRDRQVLAHSANLLIYRKLDALHFMLPWEVPNTESLLNGAERLARKVKVDDVTAGGSFYPAR